MKVIVIENGVQQIISPEQIMLGTVPLSSFLERLEKLEQRLSKLVEQNAKREQDIKKVVSML